MAQDPLVSREPVSASCNRRPDEVLETQKYSLYTKEHPTNYPLQWRLSNGLGCISHDCKLAREPLVQNIRQLEAALHQEWQQLSQQDIRRLTGGMRRKVEASSKHVGVTPGTEL